MEVHGRSVYVSWICVCVCHRLVCNNCVRPMMWSFLAKNSLVTVTQQISILNDKVAYMYNNNV